MTTYVIRKASDRTTLKARKEERVVRTRRIERAVSREDSKQAFRSLRRAYYETNDDVCDKKSVRSDHFSRREKRNELCVLIHSEKSSLNSSVVYERNCGN